MITPTWASYVPISSRRIRRMACSRRMHPEPSRCSGDEEGAQTIKHEIVWCSRRLPLHPVHHLGVGREPRPRFPSRVADDLLEDPDARAVADDVGMHGELEDPALVVRRVQLTPENIEHLGRRRVWPERLEAMHHEVH